jgi:hypothetical protein
MPVRAMTRARPFTSAIHEMSALRDPACLLDHEGIILFVNDAWERFAATRGGGERCLSPALVGSRWLDAIAGEEPRRVHAVLLHRALHRQGGGPGGAVVHTSEGNDPEVARLVATRLEPVVVPPATLVGVSVVHRTLRELPIGEVYPVLDGGEVAYRDGSGTIEQCSCCRRTRRPVEPDEWDFVPTLVAVPPVGARFGYCPLCLELHCPGGPAAGGPFPVT